MDWKDARPEKIKQVDVRLYVEECEDILRAVDYFMDHVDLKTLNKTPKDMYEEWYRTMRGAFSDMLDEIKKINEGREWK